MIGRLVIEDFKVFRSLDLRMRPLTVLTGLNGTGKSTVIQALLLTDLARGPSDWIPLNGPFGLMLGEAQDVLNIGAQHQSISFTLADAAGREKIVLTVPDDRSVALRRTSHFTSPGHASQIARVDAYLSAERLGPRDLLEVSAEPGERLRVGHQGQFTAHVLAQMERHQVREFLRHPSTAKRGEAITLSGQVRLWATEIIRPVWVQATWLPETNAATLRFRDLGSGADLRRPGNEGFGLSYALPIIVSALTAEPRALFLVENPEAHLHPAGQSAMGRFLARLAASGVQTIVETHSDHIINGMRLAVLGDGAIQSEDVVIHFFGEGAPRAIDVSPSGSLSSWPLGFFDQAEADLAKLARAGVR